MKKLSIAISVALFSSLIISGVILIIMAQQSSTIDISPEVLINNGEYVVNVEIRKRVVTLIVSKNGIPFDVLANSRIIHATVSSADLSDVSFYDAGEGAVQVSPGQYRFKHSFRKQPYSMWVEINNLTTSDHHGPEQASYVGRVIIDAGEKQDSIQEPRLSQAMADGLTMHLNTDQLRAGVSARLTYTLTNSNGQSVPLIVGIDHYYSITSPQEEYYDLQHVDSNTSTAEYVQSQPIIFPSAGRYAVRATLYADGGSTPDQFVASGIYEAVFIVEVS